MFHVYRRDSKKQLSSKDPKFRIVYYSTLPYYYILFIILFKTYSYLQNIIMNTILFIYSFIIKNEHYIIQVMLLEPLSVKDAKLNIAELVKMLRKKKGLSQKELAEKLNLSRITISNLELSKNATLDTLLKVFQYLEILETFNAYVSEEIKNNQYNSLY